MAKQAKVKDMMANVLAANGVRILYAGEATTGALSASPDNGVRR